MLCGGQEGVLPDGACAEACVDANANNNADPLAVAGISFNAARCLSAHRDFSRLCALADSQTVTERAK